MRDRSKPSWAKVTSCKTGQEAAAAIASGFKAALDVFNNILLGFAGVALFVGIFLILNTFSIIVAQRTRELALSRALGASRGQMIGAVLVEAVVIGLIASVLGLAAGHRRRSAAGPAVRQLQRCWSWPGWRCPRAAVISAFAVGLGRHRHRGYPSGDPGLADPPVAAMQEAATPDRPLTKLTVSGAIVSATGSGLTRLRHRPATAHVWFLFAGVLHRVHRRCPAQPIRWPGPRCP